LTLDVRIKVSFAKLEIPEVVFMLSRAETISLTIYTPNRVSKKC